MSKCAESPSPHNTRPCHCGGGTQTKTDISYPEDIKRHYVMYCETCGIEECIE